MGNHRRCKGYSHRDVRVEGIIGNAIRPWGSGQFDVPGKAETVSSQANSLRDPQRGKRLAKIIATFVPIWTIIILAGWIVIATLLPITVDEQQIANEGPSSEILDFMPASGPSDEPAK